MDWVELQNLLLENVPECTEIISRIEEENEDLFPDEPPECNRANLYEVLGLGLYADLLGPALRVQENSDFVHRCFEFCEIALSQNDAAVSNLISLTLVEPMLESESVLRYAYSLAGPFVRRELDGFSGGRSYSA